MARRRVPGVLFSVVLLVSLFTVPSAAGDRSMAGGNNKQKPRTKTTTPADLNGTVIDEGGYPNAVAVDGSGRLSAAYFRGVELKYAMHDGVSWQIQSVGNVGGEYGASTVALALDFAGNPGIVYHVPRAAGGIVNWVGFATHDGAAWRVEVIGIGFSPSIAFGKDGAWLVAYSAADSTGTVLRLAESTGSGWNNIVVDSSNESGSARRVYAPSVKVDSMGRVGISYGYDVASYTRQTRYAVRASGIWRITQVYGNVAEATSLVFDAWDRPHIGLSSGGGLHLLSSDAAGEWSRELLPWSGSGSPGQVSLDLDSSGWAYLTAYDTGSADLILVSGMPGFLTARVLASAGTVGRSNSLHVNRLSGQKCVTFSDQTTNQMMFMAF